MPHPFQQAVSEHPRLRGFMRLMPAHLDAILEAYDHEVSDQVERSLETGTPHFPQPLTVGSTVVATPETASPDEPGHYFRANDREPWTGPFTSRELAVQAARKRGPLHFAFFELT